MNFPPVPKRVSFFIAVATIYFMYVRSGVIQESFMSAKFTDENGEEERFKFTYFVLFIQCVAGAICAEIVIVVLRLPKNTTPLLLYFVPSISFIMAQFFSVHALLFVSYPTQVLAKSCKPIPVMIMGIFVMKRRYTLQKYFFVILMCIGIILFSYNPGKGGASSNSSFWGYGLLAISLALDGVTGPLQEKLIATHKPTSNQMMLFSNIWASAFLLLMSFITGELNLAIAFCQRHPEIFSDLLWFGIYNAIGQHAIFYLVTNFGALALSTVTTTRKFFTILGSVILFGHPVTPLQWLGVFLVFTSLSLDIYTKEARSKHLSQPSMPVILSPEPASPESVKGGQKV